MYKRIEHYVEFQLCFAWITRIIVRMFARFLEDVYETSDEPLETLVKQSLQTRQVREELHNQLGALG